MRINANMSALNTHRQLSANQVNTGRSVERLSSGLRINRAGDDAAGLAISEKMRGQIRGLNQSTRNAQDGISLIQTAEGALNETHAILQRMRELATQSANDTNTVSDRDEIQKEIVQLRSEVNRVSSTTEFNTQRLLDGSIGEARERQETRLESQTLMAFGRMTSGFTIVDAGTALDGATFSINGTNVQLGASVTGNAEQRAGHVVNAINSTNNIAVVATQTAGVITLVGRNAGESISIGGLNVAAVFGTEANTPRIAFAAVTGDTRLIDLADANGNSLNIADGDNIRASTMVGGTASQTMNHTVNAASSTLSTWLTAVNQDTSIDAVGTAAVNTRGQIEIGGVTASGIDGALSNLRFEVSGKTNFNRTFQAFSETQVAQNASSDQSLSFQIGANSGQTMAIGINEMSARSLALAGINVTTTAGAGVAISALDRAIETVSSERSKLGAFQNRLDHTINNLSTSAENLTAAESRIRDVDMAQEMMEFTKNNILSQAAQAMLAQANQLPQGVLQLLR